MQATLRISKNGQITIPREIRDLLVLDQGDYVTVDIMEKVRKMVEKGNASALPSA